MGNNGSLNVDWNDTDNLEIPNNNFLGIAYEIKNDIENRMHVQTDLFVQQFREKLAKQAAKDVQRLIDSPLVSESNKAWAQKKGMDALLDKYLNLKSRNFAYTYRKSGIVAVRRITQLIGRQTQFTRVEKYCKVQGFEDCEWVIGPVWHNKIVTNDEKRSALEQSQVYYDEISFKLYKKLSELFFQDIESEMLRILKRENIKEKDFEPNLQDMLHVVKESVEAVKVPQFHIGQEYLMNLQQQGQNFIATPTLYSNTLNLQSLMTASSPSPYVFEGTVMQPQYQVVGNGIVQLQNMNQVTPQLAFLVQQPGQIWAALR